MIKIKELYKYFNTGKSNEIHAVDGVSLQLDSGLIAIVGKSGCGKTTLLNTIGGLEKPNSGSIEIDGITIDRYSSRVWDDVRNKHIGYVFQNYNLIEQLTVYRNLELVLKLAGVPKEEYQSRIEYALKLVGMERFAGRLPSTLSGGQQQRVGVARAIVKGADIIIADEPTGNLDDTNTVAVMEILKGLSKQRLVLVVTHEEDLAAFYADRIIRIVDGKVVADENNHCDKDALDHRAQDMIYLGDLDKRDASVGDMAIDVYSDKPEAMKGKLTVVYEKGRVLLKMQGVANVTLLTEDSSIRLQEGHYEKRERQDVEQLSVDETILHPASGKPARVWSLAAITKKAAQTVMAKAGQRRKNPYRLLYATACVFVLFVAILAPSFVYNRDASVIYDDNMLAVEADAADVAALEQCGVTVVDRYMNDAYMEVYVEGLTSLPGISTTSLTVLPASLVGVTLTNNEVALDTLLYERMKTAGQLNGIAKKPNDMVGLRLKCGYDYEQAIVMTIAKIVDRDQPVLYVSDEFYASMPQQVEQYVETEKGSKESVFVFAADKTAAIKALQQKGFAVHDLNKTAEDRYYKEAVLSRLGSLIVAIVMIVMQLFCLRRIAKSQYIGEIKLYAQYRAIGVKKKEIYGKVVVENSTICAMTTLRGWLVVSVIVGILTNLQAFKMLSQMGLSMLYYPWWLALVCGAFLYLLSMVVNLISPVGLLRHTPAYLLTKYDI